VLTFCVPNAATRAQGDVVDDSPSSDVDEVSSPAEAPPPAAATDESDDSPSPVVDKVSSPAEAPPPAAATDESDDSPSSVVDKVSSPAEAPPPAAATAESGDPCSRHDPTKRGAKRKSQVCCKATGFPALCLDQCRTPKVSVDTLAPKLQGRAFGECRKWMAKQNKGKPRFRSSLDLGRMLDADFTPKSTSPRLEETPSPVDMSAEDPSIIAQAEAIENAIGVQMAMDYSDV
jgi:hypothetical protein